MNKKYAKPPVVEAVCEFRLSDDTKWDLTVAGLLYERVRNEFSIKEQRLFQQLEVSLSPQGLQQQQKTEERALFFNEDRNAFIQVGARMLAVNCLRPYPEWPGFRGHVNQGLAALKEIVDVRGVNRLGLRYINRIEIPNGPDSGTVNLDAYFDCRPFLGSRLPQEMAGFLLGVLLPFEAGRDNCKIVLSGTVAEKPNHQAFSLDIDYSTSAPLAVPPDKIGEWIEVAHHNLESAFEGCINDSLRILFEEVK
jgi:uncharacterized protein (TIGR04255 family)